MNKYISLAIILSLICLCSCSGGEKSPAPAPTQPKVSAAEKKEKVKPVLVQEEKKKPEYVVAGTRDPFQTFELATPVNMAEIDPSKITDPLQKITLSQIELVGIILGQENRALVQESSGMGYIITQGTLIGENSGIVTKISLKGVTIKQHFKDYMGRVNTREVVLSLRKEEGE
ncbi:MAG: pilus assembly protein PilP [Deltaproteobacteria bacterium]|nr:pilus assembly protein PilP [Deltaproteobacteria bacterium]